MVLAFITAPKSLRRILEHLNLPTEPPPVAPPARDPQTDIQLDDLDDPNHYLDEPQGAGAKPMQRAPP